MDKEYIINEVVKSGLNLDTKPIFKLLKANQIRTKFPSKVLFYLFYKDMIECAKNCRRGKLKLIINEYEWGQDKAKYYEFYDEYHHGARLTLVVFEERNKVELDILPF